MFQLKVEKKARCCVSCGMWSTPINAISVSVTNEGMWHTWKLCGECAQELGNKLFDEADDTHTASLEIDLCEEALDETIR